MCLLSTVDQHHS